LQARIVLERTTDLYRTPARFPPDSYKKTSANAVAVGTLKGDWRFALRNCSTKRNTIIVQFLNPGVLLVNRELE